MTYPEALGYLDSLAQFGWKLDLTRIRRLCDLAGSPHQTFPSALVGGSAGKGSTCAFLTSILRAAGRHVGCAPKPHLITHRERAQVDGELISEADFARLMARIVPLAERVTREEGSPTVFEVMTLLAFLHFAERRVDRAVVEVGLGGRFDATNILEPDLSIISTISLDHTDRLGDTEAKIALEKAGIIRASGHLLTGARGPALEVIETVARERGSAIERLGSEIRIENVRANTSGTRFDLHTSEADLTDLRVTLAGEHQARNAALAAAGALRLRGSHPSIDEQAIRVGLKRASLPGRLQVLSERPLLLLDAAHSPERADALALALREIYLPAEPGRELVLVIGCSTGHDPEVVVRRLAPLSREVIATRSRHPAAVPPVTIAAAATALGVPAQVVEAVPNALRAALDRARPEDMVLVTGSMFVVGEALAARQ